MDTQYAEHLLQKLSALPPVRVREVEDFIDFLGQREDDQSLVEGMLIASQDSFRAVWDNDEDSVYDDL